MTTENPLLPPGYSVVPPGKLASAVTCLEMREKPAGAGGARTADLSISRFEADVGAYRALFRAVGEDWLWFSRLVLSDEALTAVLSNPAIETYVLSDEVGAIGFLELDFRRGEDCEVVFLGIVERAIGTGAGSFLLDRAIEVAWSHPIRRLWLHTCHLDHAKALSFYQRAGFKPFAFWVEVFDDPRILGVLPRSIAPHVPILD